MTHPDLHTLTGTYALDALDADERRAFDAHLPDCALCREEVAGFQATAASLATAVAETPPAHLRDAVMAEITTMRQTAPATPAAAAPSPTVVALRSRRRPTRRAWLDRLVLPAAAVMAVVIAGMAVVVGNLNRRIDQMSPSSDVAAVATASDLQTWAADVPGGGSARVMYSASRSEGWFLADGMPGLGDGQVYELWLIGDNGPSAAGLFDTAAGRATHAFTGSLAAAARVGVTVEPASGSLQPTSDPVVMVNL